MAAGYAALANPRHLRRMAHHSQEMEGDLAYAARLVNQAITIRNVFLCQFGFSVLPASAFSRDWPRVWYNLVNRARPSSSKPYKVQNTWCAWRPIPPRSFSKPRWARLYNSHRTVRYLMSHCFSKAFRLSNCPWDSKPPCKIATDSQERVLIAQKLR